MRTFLTLYLVRVFSFYMHMYQYVKLTHFPYRHPVIHTHALAHMVCQAHSGGGRWTHFLTAED